MFSKFYSGRLLVSIVFLLGVTDGVSAQSIANLVPDEYQIYDGIGKALTIGESAVFVGAYLTDYACPFEPNCGSGSVYVFEQDASFNWVQTYRLQALDQKNRQQFGSSVGYSDGWLAVGAPRSQEIAPGAGAVYLFNDSPLFGWGQAQKLALTSPQEDDRFGSSVAVSGSWLIVGAPSYFPKETAGAVYIYGRDANDTWSLFTRLSPSDGGIRDFFGASVATDGTHIIVGAPGQDGFGENAGAVYLYRFDGAGITSLGKLGGANIESFGRTVSIDDDIAVVGSSTPDGAGAVFSLGLTGGVWQIQSRLDPVIAELDGEYGISVDLDESQLIVGALRTDTPVANAGSAHLYNQQPNGAWELQQSFQKPSAEVDDWFGASVAIRGSRILIAAAGGNTMGVASTGAAFLYDYVGSPPNLVAPADRQVNVDFGSTIEWVPLTGATSYALQLSADESFSSFFVDLSNHPSATYEVPSIEPLTDVYWRVRVNFSDSVGPWSNTWKFTTRASGVNVESDMTFPAILTLLSTYPNPFFDQTVIRFEVTNPTAVQLDVFNTYGQRVRTIPTSSYPIGEHEINIDTTDFSSGVYFYTLTSRSGALRGMMTKTR